MRDKPAQWHQRTKGIVIWRKDKQFEKKDLGAFLRELAAEAKQFEQEQEFRSPRSLPESGESIGSALVGAEIHRSYGYQTEWAGGRNKGRSENGIGEGLTQWESQLKAKVGLSSWRNA